MLFSNFQEQFEDTNGVIKSRKSKDRQYNSEKYDNMTSKTLQRKQTIDQHEPSLHPLVNASAPEW